jgi:hypothetical protein
MNKDNTIRMLLKIRLIIILIFFITTINVNANFDIKNEPDLQIGDSNSFVKDLQSMLNINGFSIDVKQGQPGSRGFETTYFGQMTKNSLINFQNKNKINPASGIFGPKTKEKLSDLLKTGDWKIIDEGQTISSLNINKIYSPISCPANKDLASNISNEVDGRIANISASTSTKSLWTTRGNDTDGWVWNPDVWTNRGSQAVDWTGMSPWNSQWPSAPFVKAGTLITPRNIVFANHYLLNPGDRIVFVDKDGHVIIRTLVSSLNVDSDIQVGLLDSDVPETITTYPIISSSDFNSHLRSLNTLPVVMFDQEDKALIDDSNSWNQNQIFHMTSQNAKRADFSEALIVGDSGNGGFVIIDGKPVLMFTHWTANSGPNYSMSYDKINSILDTLGGGYHVSTYNLDCFDTYPYKINTSTTGIGAGSILGNNYDKYKSGENVVLIASSSGTSVFSGWGGACSGTKECQLTMDGDKTVTANFTPAASISNTQSQIDQVVNTPATTTLQIVIPPQKQITPPVPVEYIDSDSDGVIDKNDLCPNTPTNLRYLVNLKGCIKPKSNNFNIQTNLENLDLKSVSNFVIEKSNVGKIAFNSTISLYTDSSATNVTDLDTVVKIEKNKVSIDSSLAPNFNNPATITLYGLTTSMPVITRDGVICGIIPNFRGLFYHFYLDIHS